MTILKLPHEGDTHTALIDRCAVEQGKYGDQVIFEFGPDRLYLPKLSADRQLLRCGFDKGLRAGCWQHPLFLPRPQLKRTRQALLGNHHCHR